MYSFFVLGQIPGINVTISFSMWVELVSLAIMLVVWIGYRRHTALRRYIRPTISNEPGYLQTAIAR